jgi:hypothetical protein
MRQALVCGMPGWCRSILWTLVWSLSACAAQAQAEHEHSSHEFEVFLAAQAVGGSGQRKPRDDNSWFNADVILGLAHDKFRVFGEYFITPDEHELERFQLGYEFVPDTVLWVGRFHQPASAWNTEHHHGRYLQTSITRPAIELWEDEEGLIPQHITGALLESRRPLGSVAGMQFSGGIGAAPNFSNENYEPITLVDSNPGKHGLSLSGRLAFLPDYAGTSSTGLLWSHDQIFIRTAAAMASLGSSRFNLSVYGAYADWTFGDWRIITAGYYVDVQLSGPAPNESFMSGYLQAERHLPHRLTVYGRVEDSARMQRSRYVALFNDHSGDIDVTLRARTGGLRWDYAHRQALSAEISRAVSPTDQRGVEWRLQWAAAIP